MTVLPPLHVWLYGRHVADVVDAGFGDTAVRYTEDAVTHPTGAQLSLSMPPRREVYPVSSGGRWVRSLLPEGRTLDWVVENYNIPSNDRYGLIAALGADVAGAVQVLSPGMEPGETTPKYEALDDAQVAELVARAPDAPLGLDSTRRVRLSLAGMQDKVLLHRESGNWLLPVYGAASTLIVKPEPRPRDGDRQYDGLATNEALCAALAQHCKIQAASSYVMMFRDLPALVVERYDRTTNNHGEVVRVHQEDLLGALGLDPLIKYEVSQASRRTANGGWGAPTSHARPGPSLTDLAGAVKQHLGPAFMVEFAARVAFNVAIGNADAHARNYSLLLEPDGSARHAPMYDMVCTMMYPRLDTDFAQLVNRNDDLHTISVDDLVDEVASWGIPERLAQSRIRETVEAVAEQCRNAVDTCVERGGEPAVAEAVGSLIAKRAAVLLGR